MEPIHINKEISLQEATNMTALWRDVITKETSNTKLQELRAFNIPFSDLKELLAVPNAKNFRAYLACSVEQAVDNDLNIPYKLIFVATDDKENDILESIYDFTNPCPGSCGTAPSVLLNGKISISSGE